MSDPDRDDAAEVVHTFRALAEYGERNASGMPAAQVRTLGTRRHRQRIAVTVAAVVAMVGLIGAGSVAAGSVLLRDDSTPATPGPPTRTTTTTPIEQSTSSPPPSTSSRPSTTSTTPAGPRWADAIPGDFEMEDGLTDSPRETSDKLDTPWAIDLCGSTSYPTDESRVAFRTINQPVPEEFESRQLGLYPDAATAQQVIDDFLAKLAECPRVPADSPDPNFPDKAVVWEKLDYDAGEASFVAVDMLEYSTLAGYSAAVRVGNAVYLHTRRGEWGGGAPEYAQHDRVHAEERPYADAVVARMCTFAEDPC